LTYFEIDVAKKRQAEGILLAKANGKYKGRKPIERPKSFLFYYNFYKNKKTDSGERFGLVQFMKETGLKKNTLIKFIKDEQVKEGRVFVG